MRATQALPPKPVDASVDKLYSTGHSPAAPALAGRRSFFEQFQ